MVSAKLLLVFVIVFVTLVVYLIFIYQGRVRYDAITQEGIDKLTSVGICGISSIPLPFAKQCSELAKEECTADKECISCERQVGDSAVFSCKTAVCGCGFGWSPASGAEITAFLDSGSYKAGDTMKVTGKITTKIVRDLSGEEIVVSFLDSGRTPTKNLGDGGKAKASNKDGEYEWTYKVPEDAKAGSYILLAGYRGAIALKDFSITG